MVVVSPLWRGPGNIYDFVLDGKSYQLGLATAQTLNEPTVSGVMVTMPVLSTCNLTTIACGRWSLATGKVK